jgi:hypothetical protein
VTRYEITSEQRAGWQRRAAAELVRILDTHRDLPLIAWSIASAGATLVGRVGADGTRQVFDLWRAVLALDEHTEPGCAGGTVHLRAAADRNQVRVALVATVAVDQPRAVKP